MKKLYTLAIVCENNKILLGMKKRGFGAGRFNGFGGKVLAGEKVEEAAVRELEEEANIKSQEIKELGIINFEFQGGEDILEVHVYSVLSYSGFISESEEMRPKWFNLDDIPYAKMWSDDKYWLPLFLEDKKFKAYFLFDRNDEVLEKNVEVLT